MNVKLRKGVVPELYQPTAAECRDAALALWHPALWDNHLVDAMMLRAAYWLSNRAFDLAIEESES